MTLYMVVELEINYTSSCCEQLRQGETKKEEEEEEEKSQSIQLQLPPLFQILFSSHKHNENNGSSSLKMGLTEAFFPLSLFMP